MADGRMARRPPPHDRRDGASARTPGEYRQPYIMPHTGPAMPEPYATPDEPPGPTRGSPYRWRRADPDGYGMGSGVDDTGEWRRDPTYGPRGAQPAYGAGPAGGYNPPPDGYGPPPDRYGPPTGGYDRDAPNGYRRPAPREYDTYGGASPAGGYGPADGYGPPTHTNGYGPRPPDGYRAPTADGYGPAPAGGYRPTPPGGYGPPAAGGYGEPEPTNGYRPPQPANGYGPPQSTNGYRPPADRAGRHTDAFGHPPVDGSGPHTNGYGFRRPRGYGSPPGAGYRSPANGYGPSDASYGGRYADGHPPGDTYGPPGDAYGPPGDAYGPPGDAYGPPHRPGTGRAYGDRHNEWIARGESTSGVTPHETGRWSTSRGSWVPTEPLPDNAPDYAIGRFEETGDVRWGPARGRPRVVDGVDWSERMDQRPAWQPHTWDDAPTGRSTDWSEIPLPPPRPRSADRPGPMDPRLRAATTPTERDPETDRLLGDAVPAGTVGAVLSPLIWFALAVGAYMIAVFVLNDDAERAAAIRVAIGLLPWLGLASTMSVAVSLTLRWVGAGWRAAGLGFAAAVVSGTLVTILHSLLGG
jgi:hypothetical protein